MFRRQAPLQRVDVEAICRRYIELRYQLLPYLYCLFVEAHQSGTPIMRPLLWHYQDDPVAVAVDDQFLLGPDLLVAPVVRQGAIARGVYLPRGQWFDFWTGERLAGGRHVLAAAPLETIPLFARAGAIIPFGPVRQYVGPREPARLTLHIWPGEPGRLDWYEDDGSSRSHATGNFHRRQITFTRRGRVGWLQFGPASGPYPSQVKTWSVVLHHVSRRGKATLDGKPLVMKKDEFANLLRFDLSNRAEPRTVRIF